MCQRHLWHGTYNLFGIDRIEEWIYCAHSKDDQPCRRTYIHNHGDIYMAPERPRSVAYEIPFGPRIIERKPESEVRDSSLPKIRRRSEKLTIGFKFRELFKIERVRPKSILRQRSEPEPELVDPEYVEMREPRQPRPPPVSSTRTPPPDEFVPLPPPVPSPRRQPEEEAPIFDVRSPRWAPIIHSSSPRLRQQRRRPTRPPSPEPVREVETIRVRRFDETDRGRAQRQRERDVKEEARIERERRHNAEDVNRRLAELALRERSERLEAERHARNAETQRRSAEIAAADLQQENEQLDRERRLAEREAAVLERERARERERVRDALGHPADIFPAARGAPQHTRDIPRPPPTDRGAEVIRAAQEARRHRDGERISYYDNGRRIQQGRHP